MENDPVEIVDFPMKNGDFPVRYLSSPEGNGNWLTRSSPGCYDDQVFLLGGEVCWALALLNVDTLTMKWYDWLVV